MKIICVLDPDEMDRFKAGEPVADFFETAIVAHAGKVSMHDGSMLAEYFGRIEIKRKPPTQLNIINPVFDEEGEPS